MEERKDSTIAEGRSSVDRRAEKSGYEKIYDWVAERLPGFDLEANAERLGLEAHSDGGVIVRLLGRDYLVDNGGASALDGLPTSFNHLSLAANYAMSSGRKPPTYEFVHMTALTGIPAGTGQGGSFGRESVSNPLVRKYLNDFEGLEKAALKIGGRLESKVPGYGVEYVFEALPRIPLKLVFAEPDDEFGPEFRILFDSGGLEYMEFEALAFLGGVLTQELLGYDAGAVSPDDAGD